MVSDGVPKIMQTRFWSIVNVVMQYYGCVLGLYNGWLHLYFLLKSRQLKWSSINKSGFSFDITDCCCCLYLLAQAQLLPDGASLSLYMQLKSSHFDKSM